MSTILCGHVRPYDLCHECAHVNAIREERERQIVKAAREYERAWDRYVNPSRYPDAGSEVELRLAKAHAHQALLDAVRGDGAS